MEPVSYLTLQPGAPVFTRAGAQIGAVEHVLADADADIFDGLVVDTRGGRRFVDAPEVASMDERGVTLTLDAAGVERLPEPTGNPATMSAGPEDTEPSDLGDKLRRAWDLISGKG